MNVISRVSPFTKGSHFENRVNRSAPSAVVVWTSVFLTMTSGLTSGSSVVQTWTLLLVPITSDWMESCRNFGQLIQTESCRAFASTERVPRSAVLRSVGT